MRKQFDTELQELNLELIQMGALVESAIDAAVTALTKQDAAMAREAIEFDSNVDEMERDIERRCLRLLLQQQPVARDLRQISTALKMITDLERMGDQAADIADLVLRLVEQGIGGPSGHIGRMAAATKDMVKRSVDSYVNRDLALAEQVIALDDTVDALFNEMKEDIIDMIHHDRSAGETAVDLLMIAKYFERIGDHAQNIGEWVVFSITGVHKDARII